MTLVVAGLGVLVDSATTHLGIRRGLREKHAMPAWLFGKIGIVRGNLLRALASLAALWVIALLGSLWGLVACSLIVWAASVNNTLLIVRTRRDP